jgi:sec-independent protein translocase protein TatB
MSGVSSAELLLLLVIGLIVLGPKRLPEIANKIGGWVGQARRMTRVMKRQLEEELNSDEFRNIGKPQITKQADPRAAPDPADPAYDDSEYKDEVVADHIPHDDDTFSALHAEEKDKA